MEEKMVVEDCFPTNNNDRSDESDVEELFSSALKTFSSAEYAASAEILQRIICLIPEHDKSFHLLGLIAVKQDQYPESVLLIDKAIEINGRNPRYWIDKAISLYGIGHCENAIASYDQAILLDSAIVEAHVGRAQIMFELGYLGQAITSLNELIEGVFSDNLEIIKKRGELYCEQNSFEYAIKDLAYISTRDSNYESSFTKCINLAEKILDSSKFIPIINHAISVFPDNFEFYFKRANAFFSLKNFSEAIKNFSHAYAIDKNHAEILLNRGATYQELGFIDLAIKDYQEALKIKPDYPEAYSNLGILWRKAGKINVAIEFLSKALELKPDFIEAWVNKGVALKEIGQFESAIDSFNHALELDEDFAGAHWNKALALLSCGEYELAWQAYEWRHNIESFDFASQTYEGIRWTGEQSLAGCTILVHDEQGFGDSIQFSRFVLQLLELCQDVVFCVRGPLVNLFKSLSSSIKVVDRNSHQSNYDFYIPLLSLPSALSYSKKQFLCNSFYLRSLDSDIEKWRFFLRPWPKKSIGIVWSGNPLQENNPSRSVPLDELLSAIPPEIAKFSLQTEFCQGDGEVLKKFNVKNLSNVIRTFSDTAAILYQLDLLITVDTSVAHLGGAIGKPTWLLLSRSPAWMWVKDEPRFLWYQSIKYIRQKESGNWSDVFKIVNKDLMEYFS